MNTVFVEGCDGKRRVRGGFLLAVPALALGLAWVASFVVIVWSSPAEARGIGRFLFILVNLFFTIPLAIAGLYGLRLVRRSTKSDIKGGVLSILLVAAIAGDIELYSLLPKIPTLTPDQANTFGQSMIVAAAVAIYVTACPAIMRRDRIMHVHWRHFYGKGSALLISYCILSAGICMAHERIGVRTESPLLELVAVAWPIAAAWMWYKVSLRVVHGKPSMKFFALAPRESIASED